MKGSTEVKTAIQEFQDSLLWMTSRQSSITSDVTEFADQHPSADDTCPGIITGYTKISSHNIEYNFQIIMSYYPGGTFKNCIITHSCDVLWGSYIMIPQNVQLLPSDDTCEGCFIDYT